MNYWFVIHSLGSYREHRDLIGCDVKEGTKQPRYGPFNKIKKGDKIVYYAKGDMVIVGIFDVVSNMKYLESDPAWGEDVVYDIKPDIMPQEGYALDFKALIDDPNCKFKLFKGDWRYQIWGHTCRPLPPEDFELIRKSILNRVQMKKIEIEGLEERITRKIGRPIPTIGLLYQPVDEFGWYFYFLNIIVNLAFHLFLV